jgi:hypothetical protein
MQDDVLAIYRSAEPAVGALEGAVGVLPPEELEDRLREHMASSRPKIRKAAMLAFDRLRPAVAEELWWEVVRTSPDPLRRRFARRLLRARRSGLLSSERLWQAMAEASPEVALELHNLAAHSPCPFTRIRAHLHGLLHWPLKVRSEASFEQRLRQLTYELPPYKLCPERRAVLASLIAQLPEEKQAALAGWLECL